LKYKSFPQVVRSKGSKGYEPGLALGTKKVKVGRNFIRNNQKRIKKFKIVTQSPSCQPPPEKPKPTKSSSCKAAATIGHGSSR